MPTDNARIVKDERIDALREALAYLKEQSWKYDDYRSFEAESEAWERVDAALIALESELATAKADLAHFDASCQDGHPLIQWHAEGNAVGCPLCEAKADLERARVEAFEKAAQDAGGYYPTTNRSQF